MATVACPGCGLPRVESELGAKPCPVCDAAPVATAPRAKPKVALADPTAGLPTDVSELNAPSALTRAHNRAPGAGARFAFVALAFVLGTLCGIGGVLGVQAIDWSKPKPDEQEVAEKPKDDAPAPISGPSAPQPAQPKEPAAPAGPPVPPSAPPQPGVAPVPHTPDAKPVAGEPPPDPAEPDAKLVPQPAPGVVITHEINQPEATYSIPVLKKGEHIVLKGKVKKLHVHVLDAGAVLDASGLDASVITVTGKIDNGSKLKLKAPNGAVQISSKIDGKSSVEIVAPDGEVKFTAQTNPRNEGAKIDNGSTVKITARVVEFKGDIGGADTKVSVILTRNAWLKVASVSGKATVEYKPQVAGWSPPDVIVGPVAPGATFRKID